MCIAWIYVLANELVGLLGTIGLIFHIPSVVLGATVLAWGNSLGGMQQVELHNLLICRYYLKHTSGTERCTAYGYCCLFRRPWI